MSINIILMVVIFVFGVFVLCYVVFKALTEREVSGEHTYFDAQQNLAFKAGYYDASYYPQRSSIGDSCNDEYCVYYRNKECSGGRFVCRNNKFCDGTCQI